MVGYSAGGLSSRSSAKVGIDSHWHQLISLKYRGLRSYRRGCFIENLELWRPNLSRTTLHPPPRTPVCQQTKTCFGEQSGSAQATSGLARYRATNRANAGTRLLPTQRGFTTIAQARSRARPRAQIRKLMLCINILRIPRMAAYSKQ